jgi:hypothetical protein
MKEIDADPSGRTVMQVFDPKNRRKVIKEHPRAKHVGEHVGFTFELDRGPPLNSRGTSRPTTKSSRPITHASDPGGERIRGMIRRQSNAGDSLFPSATSDVSDLLEWEDENEGGEEPDELPIARTGEI